MKYSSIFKDELKNYVMYKKTQGYDYKHPSILKKFDEFIKDRIKTKEITQQIYEEWIMKQPNESQSMQIKKYSFIKNFTKYLIMNKYTNIYFNDEYRIKYNTYFVPYIFNENEIKNIFSELKNWNIRTYCKNDKNVFIVLFSVLYCCGLRISEALNLKYDNINFENETIEVLNSKNHKSRIIPISLSLSTILKKFINSQNFNEEGYLFHDDNFNKYKYEKVWKCWKRVVKNANIANNKIPTIHSFRHTFAINSLNQMEEKGYDIYTALPLLSTYLGHKGIKETEYYLRLTDNFSENIVNKSQKYCKSILGGYKNV